MNKTIHFTSGDANFLRDVNERRFMPVPVTTRRPGQRAERREIQPTCQVQEDGKVVSGLSTAVRPTSTGRTSPSTEERMRAMLRSTVSPQFQLQATAHHSIESDFSGLERRVLGMLPELGAPLIVDGGHIPMPADPDFYTRAVADWRRTPAAETLRRVVTQNRTCLMCGAPESQQCGC